MASRADETRDVHVVPAGVHDKHFVARDRVDLARARRVLEPGLFLDRQTIHVGAHHDQRPFAVLEHGNDTRTTDAFGHLEARQAQLHGHATSRLMFDRRQLGIAVEMIEQRRQVLVVVSLYGVGKFVAQCGQGDKQGQEACGALDHRVPRFR